MVPTAKESLFSRTELPFSKIKYTLFKGNQDTGQKKTYHSYSMHDQLLTFVWYSRLLTPSSCLIHTFLFKF